MADPNPYAKYATNPYAQYGLKAVGPADDMHAPELRGKILSNEKAAALTPYEIRKQAADAAKSELDLQNAREQYTAAHPKVDSKTAGLYGPAFLNTLNQSDRPMVEALIQGRMAFPQGAALRAPFWQEKLSQVSQADPTFDATNFNARAAARKNAISGKLGASDNALSTAIGHAAHLLGQADGTASHGGFLGATTVNAIQNAYNKSSGDPGITTFTDTANKLADEMEAVYRNGGGSEAGTVRQLRSLDPNASAQQKHGVIMNAIDLLASKAAANAAQYNFGNMGQKPDLVLLSPQAKDALSAVAPDIAHKYFGTGFGPDHPGGPGGGNGPTAPGTGGGGSPDGTPPGPDQSSAASGGYRSEHSARMDSMVNSMVNAGAGMASINAALAKASYPALDAKTFNAAKKWMADTGKPYFAANITRNVPLNLGQQIAGSAIGSGLAHMADAATAGTVGALAGEQGRGALDAMAAMHPDASVMGDVVGGVTGAGGAEAAAARMAGAGALAKYAPRIADSLYGGVSGFNAAPDGSGGSGALTGALAGAAGGAAGEYGMKALGGLLKGVANPSARYLRGQGIPLTAGQAGGGFLKSVEDAMTHLPGVGNMIDARRKEGLIANAGAMGQQAVAPIGGVGAGYGEAAANDLIRQGGDAYTAATAGAHVPLGAQTIGQLGDARALGSTLPDDLAARFGKALDNRVNPILDAGALTGDSYQQAMRGLKSYRAESPNPGFEQDYRNALGGVMDTLKGQMTQGGGADVVQNLAKADEAWKNIKVFQKATQAAKNGTGGDLGLPMPSQFNNAAQQAANKYGGPRPMAELIDAGQSVLPSKLPDSGTGKRLMVGAALGSLGGGGGYLAGDGEGSAIGGGLGLGATLALMAGGMKGNQKLLVKALLDRPDLAIHLGNALGSGSRYGGILGAAVGTRLPPFAVGP